jgi:hypothetical protein
LKVSAEDAVAAKVAYEALTEDPPGAHDADKANDDEAAKVAYDADTAFEMDPANEPLNEPVNDVAIALPLMFIEPVTVWVSVRALPIFTPVFVT